MRKLMTFTITYLFQCFIQEALSCTCVKFHKVPSSTHQTIYCSNGSIYNGRAYYYTNNKLAYLFYDNLQLNGTWKVGASLGTSNYYLISYGNASSPQNTTSWHIKRPSSSIFHADPDISVKCYSYSSGSWYLTLAFVPVVGGLLIYMTWSRAKRGKLCKKQNNQNRRSRRCYRLFPCCGHQQVGVVTETSTSGTTQRSNGPQPGQRMSPRTRQNGRVGQEGRETGRRGSISDLPGYCSTIRNNGRSEAQGGVRHIQVSDGRDPRGLPAYPPGRGFSPPPSYSSIWTSLPGGDNVPPPPAYEVAITLPQYR